MRTEQTAGLLAALALLAVVLTNGCENPASGSTGAPPAEPAPPADEAPADGDSPARQLLEIDFDSETEGYVASGFAAAGTASEPEAGYLDADSWRITGFSDGDLDYGGVADGGDFARGPSPGGVSIGGLYAFAAGDGASLGVQPTGSDFAPGTIELRIPVTIASVSHLSLAYTLWINNDEDRATNWTCAISVDDTPDGSWIAVDRLAVVSPGPADGASWVDTPVSTRIDITSLGLANGSTLYVRWTAEDDSGSGGRDEAAIDDIVVVLEE